MERLCDKIDAYEDGELTGEEGVLFEKHMESCPLCRRELDWLRSLNTLFSKMPVKRPPRGIEQAVLTALGFERKPVWTGVLGWATSGIVGAWIVLLGFLVREAALKSITPTAKGLAGIPSLFEALGHGLHAALNLLKPVGLVLTALVKATSYVPVSGIAVLAVAVGLMAAFGIWYTTREVGYARAKI
ncbi:hypothetical protein E3J62_06955 [candidate division TA06 bacterium]|uniref:Putative zinc-finger domain-containing protein n=1 Tax=candidate division TA06 bacterium TaxID=2250710 RepID=A0A523USU5_UNCT6|nr:MAG: hypothetical protein E3J62_06955 [candidate division TA06 bacterium]